MLREILATACKEFRGFFSSPSAYIFLGGFLSITYFVFFWGEAFFTRNIADLRPMFAWMPVITIFLAGVLTMRSWAEELRAGTIETLMTLPARSCSLVLGKFIALESLVALALVLTLPLVFTVAMLGPLDLGPVFGGYIATLCVAASYLSIGLFISAQTDNSVVSVIVTVLVCSLIYIVGSGPLVELVDRGTADILTAIGTGARFESITRGVLDLRDLYYYASIVGIFLTLNTFQLRRLRWSGGSVEHGSHRSVLVLTFLIMANFFTVNLWLSNILSLRTDLTAERRYTLSPTTAEALANIQEPLLIRGYFSSQTHPLLAPLVPQICDILSEYALIGGDRVRVEITNPTENPDAERSALEAGIKPTPFQTASRYKSSVVSSYFDILVSYGDESVVLDFRDLIDIKSSSGDKFEVGLANPEYSLTSSIKKVVQAYRSGGDPFALISSGLSFHGYISPVDRLPPEVLPIREALMQALEELQERGNFEYKIENPDANGGELAQRLLHEYGLSPQVTSLLEPNPFWFSLRLRGNGRDVPVILSDSGVLDVLTFKEAIDRAARRLASGLLRTVALATPLPAGIPEQVAVLQPGPRYTQLREKLGENFAVVGADLSKGVIDDDVDVLIVLAPKHLEKRELFAIDQFLMRGGTVFLATSDYRINMTSTALSVSEEDSGLKEWLAAYGITIGSGMVLDPENTALPIPVQRSVNGYTFQEIIMVPYPYFPDIRTDGLAQDHPITASLGQMTVNWASPIHVDPSHDAGLEIHPLVRSSSHSWLSHELNVVPDYEFYPDSGFPQDDSRDSYILAVAVTGRFTSAFANQDSPLLVSAKEETRTEEAALATPSDEQDSFSEISAAQKENDVSEDAKTDTETVLAGKISHSPQDAHLVVVSSSNFASDVMLSLASRGSGVTYMRPVDFIQNVVDWATEDPSLLTLRGKTRFAGTLQPISENDQMMVEYANYIFGMFGLLAISLWRRVVSMRDRKRYARILEGMGT